MGVISVRQEGGGLREQNKRDKLARIITAARELFGRTGIDNTTLREVAAAAGVGTGTLFLYARTKEDLLVVVFLAELQPVMDNAFAHIPQGTLHRQLMASFMPIVEHHARNMLLSRPFLRDTLWVSEPHAAQVRAFTTTWMGRLVALVDGARERGEIRSDVDSTLVAQCARHLFLGQLRTWVAGATTRPQFDASLPASLQLLLDGAAPAAAASPAPRPGDRPSRRRA
jgi:TetR/AcrR family transcriptional regulator, cholesterol catabolism regulator